MWSPGPGWRAHAALDHGSKAVGPNPGDALLGPGPRSCPRHCHLACAITASLVFLLNSFLPSPPNPIGIPQYFFLFLFFLFFCFFFCKTKSFTFLS